jgi:signal peptide peptidase SppA
MQKIRCESIIKFFKAAFYIVIVLTIAMLWYDYGMFWLIESDEYYSDEFFYCPEDSNVAVIKLYGDIVTYSIYSDDFAEDTYYGEVSSEYIVETLDIIEADNTIEAVIVLIDSLGGAPVASEEIADALKRMTKPTIAVIKDSGLSGAYLAATGADRIFASEFSDVGDIGVTMSYLDYSKQNKEEGIIYQQLSSGKFKDAGYPDKELTQEERNLFMENIQASHQVFVKKVAENRGLDIKTVEELADGSFTHGRSAIEKGLIDEIGSVYDAQQWLRNQLSIDPIICVY